MREERSAEGQACVRCAGGVAVGDRYCRHCGARLQSADRALPEGGVDAYWSAALEEQGDAFALMDGENTVRRANAAFAAWAGREPEALVGVPLAELLRVPESGWAPSAGAPACGFHLIADDAYLISFPDRADDWQRTVPLGGGLPVTHEELRWEEPQSLFNLLLGASEPVLEADGPLPPATLLRNLAEEAVRRLAAESLALSLFDPARGELATVVAYRSKSEETWVDWERPIIRRLRELPLYQRVITERETLFVSPASLVLPEEPETGGALLVPLSLPEPGEFRSEGSAPDRQPVVGVLAARVPAPARAILLREPAHARAAARRTALLLETMRRQQSQARAYEDLSRVKEYYQAILDSLGSGVFVVGSRGVVQFWNRAMEQMTGIPRDQVMRANLFARLPHLEPYRERIQGLGRSRKPFRIERLSRSRQLPDPDPDFEATQEVTETYLFQPLLHGGRLAGVLGVVDDITLKMRLDTQLVRSERMAAVGELAAGVAHNFNNILAAIGGDAQLLKLAAEQQQLPDSIAETAQMIYEETMRGGRIAHDLLSFARGLEPKLQVLDVTTVIQDTIRLASNHSAAKPVSIETEIRPNLPKVDVDPNQLHQVFFNIILNALQAMPGGGTLTISARVRAASDDPERGVIEVSFVDTGVGLSEEQQRRVFDPFFTSRQNGSLGTGLGLTVSLSMVRGMGGDIQFQSAPGKGTTVSVTLPIVERRTEHRGGTLQRGRLLVVDDEPSVRRTLASFLARRGYKVDTAQDGEEAVTRFEEALREQPYEVVVMDLMLPKRDGAQAIREIRARAPKAEVVVLTGVTTTEAVREALEAGARFSFSKPANFAELLNVVECLRREPRILAAGRASKPSETGDRANN
jgi:two-component system cell cycle sensor histidine kinase/response regulator CckA